MEGLFERMNWLNAELEDDEFGRLLLLNGMKKETILEWSKDPQVTFDDKKGSLFDAFEDMNMSDCIAKACGIKKEDIN